MGPEVAAGVAAISTLLSAGAGMYAASQKYEAADQAEEIAELNARNAEMEAEESARRLEKQQASNQSLARARAAASGAGGESVANYLEDMEREDENQLDWIRRAGSSQAGILRRQGAHAATAARGEATAGMITAGAQVIGGASRMRRDPKTGDFSWD